MFERLSRPATAIALTALVAAMMPAGAAGQAPPTIRSTLAFASESTPAESRALKASYHVRLISNWPQEAGPGGCLNGGDEVVEGTLAREADGTYAGTFIRRTRLLFCGAHGMARGDSTAAATGSCALTLDGEGRVSMTGVVVDDETSPSGRSARVVWVPAEGSDASVTGVCGAAFKDALAGMYRTSPHGAEFPLTTVGQGPRTEQLENYAWKVELE
jgi:hypothetical protein